jgi:hypothetical protein
MRKKSQRCERRHKLQGKFVLCSARLVPREACLPPNAALHSM